MRDTLIEINKLLFFYVTKVLSSQDKYITQILLQQGQIEEYANFHFSLRSCCLQFSSDLS